MILWRASTTVGFGNCGGGHDDNAETDRNRAVGVIDRSRAVIEAKGLRYNRSQADSMAQRF